VVRLGRRLPACLIAGTIASGQAAAPPQETNSEGLITARNGAEMPVKSASGDVVVTLSGATEVKEKEARSDCARSRRPVGLIPVADLDKGECGARAAAMWGCKFDASGNETACDVATLDEKNDEVVIVTASK